MDAGLRNFVRQPIFWGMVLLIWAGKVLWLLADGIHLEDDSKGYLMLQADFFHPPLYNLFAVGLFRFSGLEAIVTAQGIFYSFAVTWLVFACKFSPGRLLTWALAFLLAADPCMGHLCNTIMSESLSVTMLLCGFAWLSNLEEITWKQALLAGTWAGINWLTRYTAVLLIPVFIYLLWTQGQKIKKITLHAALFVLAFQLMLAPLRLYYLQNFGTLRMNAFTGLSLWNNSAWLYPGSETRNHPQSGFEKFLQTFPDSTFSKKATFLTSQIHSEANPWKMYVTRGRLNTHDAILLSDTLSAISRRLIISQPLRYFSGFVVPNFIKPLAQDEITPNAGNYYSLWWKLLFPLLLITTGTAIVRRKYLSATGKWLLVYCWLYLISITPGAVIFLRYLYLLAPFILVSAAVTVESFSPRKDATRF